MLRLIIIAYISLSYKDYFQVVAQLIDDVFSTVLIIMIVYIKFIIVFLEEPQ